MPSALRDLMPGGTESCPEAEACPEAESRELLTRKRAVKRTARGDTGAAANVDEGARANAVSVRGDAGAAANVDEGFPWSFLASGKVDWPIIN